MLRIFVICLALVFVAARSGAQEVPIQDVIRQQIQAFEADDFDKAFTFASPNIHALFGSAETFGKMVRQGYPMVVHPSDVTMMDLRTIGGALWQRVRITDGKGKSYLMDYQMIEGPDGWLINAVQLQVAPDVGA